MSLRGLVVLGVCASFAGLGACGDNIHPTDTLVISPGNATVAILGTASLSATYQGQGARDHVAAELTWSSSDDSLVTVVGDGATAVVTGVATGEATITARDEFGVTGTATITVEPKMLVSIEVDPVDPSIALGTTVALSAIGHYDDNSTQDITAVATWASADPGVATVDTTGLVTSAAVGSTAVSATLGPISGSTTVTVTSATLVSLAITPPDPTIPLGTSQAFTATGTFTDATTQDLTTAVTWMSSDTTVATIGSDGVAHSPNAGNKGPTTITATDPATSISATTTLTVTDASLVSIAVTPPAPTIPRGTNQAFVATGTYTDATTQDLTSSVMWTSSDTTIATIGSDGVAQSPDTGALGPTTITATDPVTSLAGTATLTVTSAVLVSIAVTPVNPSIAKGRTQAFVATGTFSDGTTANLTSSVTWTSSDTSVATISNASGSQGLATSPNTGNTGTTLITATDPTTSIAGSTTLTVTAAVLVSIDVTPSTASIPKGSGQDFVATGTFSDASVQILTTSVTWSTSDGTVATVSNAAGSQGHATAAGLGTATITATDPATLIAGSATLTVTDAALVSIQVTPADSSVALGVAPQFTATGVFTDGSVQDLTTSATWTSSLTSVATISNAAGSSGLASTAMTGMTTITATDPATMIAGSTTLTVTAATLVRIDVTPTDETLPKALTENYLATAVFSDGTTQDYTSIVTWTSSDTTVATISNASPNQGLATTISGGTTTITATDPTTLVAGSTTLTVTNAVLRSITVEPATATIARGAHQQFVALGHYSDGTTHVITNAVTWSSSAPSIANIGNSPRKRGIATGKKPGIVTITAALNGITGTAALTVSNGTLVSIAITPADPQIANGTQEQLTATGTFSDGSTSDITASVAWSSSNTGVATISNRNFFEGTASAVGVGTTTITAFDSATGVSGTTTLTVTNATLVSIAITPADSAIVAGFTEPLTATATFSDNTTQDVTAQVTWSSSDATIATVANTQPGHGLLTAVAAGMATITARYPLLPVTGTTGVMVDP